MAFNRTTQQQFVRARRLASVLKMAAERMQVGLESHTVAKGQWIVRRVPGQTRSRASIEFDPPKGLGEGGGEFPSSIMIRWRLDPARRPNRAPRPQMGTPTARADRFAAPVDLLAPFTFHDLLPAWCLCEFAKHLAPAFAADFPFWKAPAQLPDREQYEFLALEMALEDLLTRAPRTSGRRRSRRITDPVAYLRSRQKRHLAEAWERQHMVWGNTYPGAHALPIGTEPVGQVKDSEGARRKWEQQCCDLSPKEREAAEKAYVLSAQGYLLRGRRGEALSGTMSEAEMRALRRAFQKQPELRTMLHKLADDIRKHRSRLRGATNTYRLAMTEHPEHTAGIRQILGIGLGGVQISSTWGPEGEAALQLLFDETRQKREEWRRSIAADPDPFRKVHRECLYWLDRVSDLWFGSLSE